MGDVVVYNLSIFALPFTICAVHCTRQDTARSRNRGFVGSVERRAMAGERADIVEFARLRFILIVVFKDSLPAVGRVEGGHSNGFGDARATLSAEVFAITLHHKFTIERGRRDVTVAALHPSVESLGLSFTRSQFDFKHQLNIGIIS